MFLNSIELHIEAFEDKFQAESCKCYVHFMLLHVISLNLRPIEAYLFGDFL